MINLNKYIEEEDLLIKLSQYMQDDFNSGIYTYEEKPFLLLSSCDESDRIETFLHGFYDDIDRQWDIDLLFNYNYGYDDEYTTCSGCCQIIRTSPDCYSWQPDFLMTEYEILCKDCYTDNEIIDVNMNNPDRAINSSYFDTNTLIEYGFELINKESYQNGLYAYMDDDPKEIYAKLESEYTDIIFVISEQSQFYISFDVYGRR